MSEEKEVPTTHQYGRTWVLAALALGAALAGGSHYLPSWLTWQRGTTATAAVLAVSLRLLYLYQDKLLYFPQVMGYSTPQTNPKGYRSPADWGIPFREVRFQSKDGVKLTCWFMYHEGTTEKKPTIMFFQGNAGNSGFRLPNFQMMHEYLDVNIFALSYRGYGASEGVPTEKGLQMDAEAALEFVQTIPEVDPNKILLFGRSLGGAVAIYLASKEPEKIRGTIVENTFTNIGDMVDVIFPIVKYVKGLVLKIDWNNKERAPLITHPLFVIIGTKDELVPPVHGEIIFEKAVNSSCRRILKILNGTHNETWRIGRHTYVEGMKEFIKEALSIEPKKVSSKSSSL